MLVDKFAHYSICFNCLMETDLAASTSLTSSTSTTSTSTSAGLPDTASSSIKRAAGPNQGDENPSKRIKKVAERQELMDVEGTRQVHFNWQAKVWCYMRHDCEEDEFQEEDTEEIIRGQRVVYSRARLHLLEGKIK